jgi:hypothetical protein
VTAVDSCEKLIFVSTVSEFKNSTAFRNLFENTTTFETMATNAKVRGGGRPENSVELRRRVESKGEEVVRWSRIGFLPTKRKRIIWDLK